MTDPEIERDVSRYHLVGIGGIGMSAIARLLLRRGMSVSGSDERPSDLIRELTEEGARVVIGHRAQNVGEADVVVVSSAIRHDNPEFVEAHRRGVPVVLRGEMLARVIGSVPTVAVAGTHGKTTTTAMIATIFEHAGLDPTVAVGGERIDSCSNARSGDGPWFITESDESDGSFLRLSPQLAVVTNIENDHIACDADLPRLIDQFATFLAKIPPSGTAVIGIDNTRSATLVERPMAAAVVTFATGGPADLQATAITFAQSCAFFTVVERGAVLGRLTLNVPGIINVQNALAAIGVARAAGVPFATVAAALAGFHGVRRRFEVVGRSAALTVIDDYAHHPTAVAETIAAARHFTDGPVIVAFQPHRYTRTAYLAADFARALAGADRVYLTPIYAAAETPLPGVSERLIGEPLAAAGAPVRYVAVEELELAIRAEAPLGAVVLMLGAGSISIAAHRLGARSTRRPTRRPSPHGSPLRTLLNCADRSALREHFGSRVYFDEPLAPFTWWQIGGPADALVNVESQADVAFVLRHCFKRRLPWFVLGLGSNILVGDGGIRGLVLRLGGSFSALEVEADGERVSVRAGASAQMALLTAQAASRGARGIESLAGIPGSVGGALCMNAGTDREFGEFVRDVWVHTATKPDAHPVSVQYFYRHTTLTPDAIVAAVTLEFACGDPAVVRAQMQARLVRRKQTQPIGLPNAGSCFRNPPGATAGSLIESVGAKGWRVGGAEVSPLHANFIVNVADAKACDVTMLLARVRRAVRDACDVDLQLEVHLVGEFVA